MARYPSSIPEEGALWITIDAYEIDNITTNRGGVVTKGDYVEEFMFLAPNEIQESLQHTWEPYETIGMRVADFLGKTHRFAQTLNTTGAGAANELLKSTTSFDFKKVGVWAKDKFNGIGGVREGLNAASIALDEDVAFTRVDAPLVYKNSERRQYDFIFNLFYAGGSTGPDKEIMYPVRTLQRLSSVTMKKNENKSIDSALVNPPYIFEISSEPNDYFHIKDAALISIQPTFRGPYKNGIPTSCELHLTFKEITPVWGNSYEQGEGNSILSITSSTSAMSAEELYDVERAIYIKAEG